MIRASRSQKVNRKSPLPVFCSFWQNCQSDYFPFFVVRGSVFFSEILIYLKFIARKYSAYFTHRSASVQAVHLPPRRIMSQLYAQTNTDWLPSPFTTFSPLVLPPSLCLSLPLSRPFRCPDSHQGPCLIFIWISLFGNKSHSQNT